MTFLYTSRDFTSATRPDQRMINLWKHITTLHPEEDEWIDVTRRETMDGAEAAIDGSIEHYSKKLEFLKGPKVVKTFE